MYIIISKLCVCATCTCNNAMQYMIVGYYGVVHTCTCTQLMSDSRDLELLVCQFAGANETTNHVATNVDTQWTLLCTCTYKLYISS